MHADHCLAALERRGLAEFVDDPGAEDDMEYRLIDSYRNGWTVENFEPLGSVYQQVTVVAVQRLGDEAVVELGLPLELGYTACPICLLNERCNCTADHVSLIEIAADSMEHVWRALMMLPE